MIMPFGGMNISTLTPPRGSRREYSFCNPMHTHATTPARKKMRAAHDRVVHRVVCFCIAGSYLHHLQIIFLAPLVPFP